MNDLKSTAIKSILWNAVDKVGVQSLKFAAGVVLARKLAPDDFGLIALLSLIIAVSNTLIESGLSMALVQNKQRTDEDFSTVFVYNVFVSGFLYATLFVVAPIVADFYHRPELTMLTRILSLNLIVNSFGIIQQTRLVIAMNFRALAKVNAVSVVVGGLAAIAMAYTGWGVWSLVMLTMGNSIVSVLMLWVGYEWKISMTFSQESFSRMSRFGSKLLIASLYAQTLREVYNVIIGKIYTTADVGFFSKGRELADLSSGVITNVFHQVTFPLLVTLQDDKVRMMSTFRRLVRISAFVIVPAMTLLSVLADSFVRALLTEKWIAVVPLLQILCFGRIFFPASSLNLNLLNANGRSDLLLKVDLSKFPVVVVSLLITMPLGIKAMVIGSVVTAFISFMMNTYYTGKMFGYGGGAQIKDMLPFFLASLLMAIVVAVSINLVNNPSLRLFAGGCIGIVCYLFIAKIAKLQEVDDFLGLAHKVMFKR